MSSASRSLQSLLRKVPEGKLGVSEPNPRWFGNPSNESSNPNWTNENWLKSRFHFSFAEYSNPKNQGFGVLRVMNDDLVQPLRGFGEHPHRDVEICTYIVQGELTHQDSMGTKETLSRGAIQFMTAGRGVQHSEHNLHPTDPLRFIQIWINTRQRGLAPNYGSSVGDKEKRSDQWHHMVMDVNNKQDKADIAVNQDVNIFVSEISANNKISTSLSGKRQGYLLMIEGSGSVGVNDETEVLNRHDAAEVFGSSELTITAGDEGAHVLLVEMDFTGLGRTDL